MRQRQALTVMLGGGQVFLTGPPGAGKTYVLNEFLKRASKRGKKVAVTASTGIAATHIGGTTIHSWSGLGIRDELTAKDKDWLLANERLKSRYQAADILVIDEISMLHGKRLDMVDAACQLLRENDAPFGGLQVILVGDLFQLPPISRGRETIDFAHTSKAWQDLEPQICYLTEQHRQGQDQLLEILEAMRLGQIEEWHQTALMERLEASLPEYQPVTRLYTHNVDVDIINEQHLSDLADDGVTFAMSTKGAASKVEQLIRGMLAPEVLTLKAGAEVMFVANNPAAGFVNGSRGQVVAFKNGLPIVQLLAGERVVKVEPHSWTLQEDGKVRAEVTQLPLRLAWAITIHKSQGMSLDAAEVDLSKSFTPGMGYVALSRVRSMDGIYLRGINRTALALHPDIFAFDEELRRASEALAATVTDAPEDESPTQEEPTAQTTTPPNAELLAKLKTWRIRQAQTEGMPAYIVAHNKLLEVLAASPPATKEQLARIPGLGPRKLEKYGAVLLELTAPYATSPTESENSPQETSIEAEWTSEEDGKLIKLWNSRASLEEVCHTLQRSPDSVWTRLASLITKSDSNQI